MIKRLNQGLLKTTLQRFATGSAASLQNYKNLQSLMLEKKAKIQSDFHEYKANRAQAKQAYQHPFDHEDYPVNLTNHRTIELLNELIGPEQTSVHFETFSRTRKYMFSFTGIFLGMSFFVHYGGFDWVSSSMQAFVLMDFLFFYFALEARKFLFAPLQMQWY